MGIYSILETSKGSILNFEHQLSNFATTGNDGTISALKVGALLPTSRDTILAGWQDTTTYGIDQTTTTTRVASYGGYFESVLYQVGTYLNKRQFTKMEFYLAKELAASEGIQVKYRINLTDTWTTLGTYTTTIIGTGKTSFIEKEIKIPPCEQIQIRIELNPGASNLTTPQFKNLILQ